MPLTQPSAGGIARKNLLVSSKRNTSQSLTGITLGACEYDPVKNRILMGLIETVGTIPLVGTLPDFKSQTIREFSTSPNTVIGNSTIIMIHRNGVDGGVIILTTAGGMALTSDDGLTWRALNTGFGNTEYDINSWRDNQLVNFHRGFVPGANDLFISNDNGVTFPLTHYTGLANTNKVFAETTDDDKIYIVLGFNGEFSWTDSEDMATAVFNPFPAGSIPGFTGNVTAFAANGDSSKAIICDIAGNIIVTTDGFLTWTLLDEDINVFRDGGGTFAAIHAAVYVADIGGFIVIGTNETAGFIPEKGALDSMQVVSFAMTAAQQPDVDEGSTITSDGIEMICIAANVDNVMQLPYKN